MQCSKTGLFQFFFLNSFFCVLCVCVCCLSISLFPGLCAKAHFVNSLFNVFDDGVVHLPGLFNVKYQAPIIKNCSNPKPFQLSICRLSTNFKYHFFGERLIFSKILPRLLWLNEINTKIRQISVGMHFVCVLRLVYLYYLLYHSCLQFS